MNVLASPLFLAATALLLVNDFVLKALMPGTVTGKLSDFAGVFAFAVFWMAVFPNSRRTVLIVVAAAFTAWKSPVVQPLIELWNASMPFRIGRTVDATDLIALITLPFALTYVRREHPPVPRTATAAIVAIASVSFVATSYYSPETYSDRFQYAGTTAELVSQLRARGIQVFGEGQENTEGDTELQLWIPSTMCFDTITAQVIVVTRDGKTEITLTQLAHRCPRRRGERELMYRTFTETVVQPLALTRPR